MDINRVIDVFIVIVGAVAIMNASRPIKPIVSFDFDGTLHNDVVIGKKWNKPTPSRRNNVAEIIKRSNGHMIKKLVKECEKNDIYIVTSRFKNEIGTIDKFLRIMGIRGCVKKIIATGRKPKSVIMNRYKIIRHYEDSLETIREVRIKSPTTQVVIIKPRVYK